MSDAAATPAATTASSPAPVTPSTAPAPGTKVFYKPTGDREGGKQAKSRAERISGLNDKLAELSGKKTDVPAADAPAVETKAEPAKESEKQTDSAKAQFAALARADKRLREERKALEEERTKAKAEREAHEAKLADARRLQALVDGGDKYKVLDALGLDINEWARRKLGQPDVPKPQPNEAMTEVDKIRRELAERDARDQAATAEANFQAAKRNSLAEISALVQADKDKYALIQGRNAHEAVFETIAQAFAKTGRLMSYAEACDAVETYLENDAASYLGIEKIRKKLAVPATGAASSQDDTSSAEQRPTKITTRTQPNKTTAPDRVATGRLTREERRRQAVALLSAPPDKR